MPQEHEHAVIAIHTRGLDRSAPRGADRRALRSGDIDPGMRFGGISRPHLPPGHEPLDVQRPMAGDRRPGLVARPDRKSTRLNSSHVRISYAVFCLKKKKSD